MVDGQIIPVGVLTPENMFFVAGILLFLAILIGGAIAIFKYLS